MIKLNNFLPNINLTNENNITDPFHQIIKDKTIVLNMFYSNCDIKCVPLGNHMKRVNLLLKNYIKKENIHFVSITLDAENDTIDDLNNFKKKVYSKNCQNWNFYTGNYNEIENLRYKLGMYSPEPELDAVKSNHTGNFMIFNANTGFVKHTQAFDNPIDIARKIIQIIPRNFYCHYYTLTDINYDALTDDEIFDNIQTMNPMFTVSFLPKHIKDKYSTYAEKQRGFQYKPPINIENKNIKKMCRCKKNS